MNRFLPLALITLLAACGESDPTPEAEDAASAPAINAAVEEAENIAVNAQLAAEGNLHPAEENVARKLIDDGDDQSVAPNSRAAQRPTKVDPSAGDPLPPVP